MALDTPTVRFGGAFGVICAVAMVPTQLVRSPGADYGTSPAFDSASGVLPMLHILFGIAFLGVLVAMLRHASGPTASVYAALGGAVLYVTLTAGGLAAEVAYPVSVVRFGDAMITQFNDPLLTLSTWLHHYCQIGAAAMILASSWVIWRTGVLPRWAAALAILGVPPLLYTWIPLPAELSSLTWIFLIGLAMLMAPNVTPATPQPVGTIVLPGQEALTWPPQR